MIDLHMHTTMSDGQYTPSQVVRLAKQKAIDIMAITDHDTVSGVEEGMAAAGEAGIEFIPGIEISAKDNKELHILGYFIDIHNPQLKGMCDEFCSLRAERESRILEYLNGKNLNITKEQVRKHVSHGRVGRPHFAMALLEAGYVSSLSEAFDKYLATPEFEKIERPKPSAREGIRVIKEAGGVAVMAHPAQLKLSRPDFEALLGELINDGLEGLECHYSTHTKDETSYYLSVAEENNIIVTGGSDFHGERIKPDIEMGTGIRGSLCFNDADIVTKLQNTRR